MRTLLLVLICFLGLNSFGQTFTYSFKFEEVTDQYLAKEVSPVVTQIFDAGPEFVPLTGKFFIKSTVEIGEVDFTDKMLNKGYNVIFFEKAYINIEGEDRP